MPDLRSVEILPGDTQVSPYPVDGSCGQVPVAMPRNRSFLVVGRVDPDFVRTSCLMVEDATQSSELPRQLPVGHTATEMLPCPVRNRAIRAGRGFPRSW